MDDQHPLHSGPFKFSHFWCILMKKQITLLPQSDLYSNLLTCLVSDCEMTGRLWMHIIHQLSWNCLKKKAVITCAQIWQPIFSVDFFFFKTYTCSYVVVLCFIAWSLTGGWYLNLSQVLYWYVICAKTQVSKWNFTHWKYEHTFEFRIAKIWYWI